MSESSELLLLVSNLNLEPSGPSRSSAEITVAGVAIVVGLLGVSGPAERAVKPLCCRLTISWEASSFFSSDVVFTYVLLSA